MRAKLFLISSVTFALSAYAIDQPASFSQSDKDRLIRIEAILEQHDKRFDAIDRRIEELRADMNAQTSEVRADMRNIMLLFGGLVAAIIGFAVWDRRTMIRPFEMKIRSIDSALEQLKEEKTAGKIVAALRELAKTDSRLAEVLKSYNLL